MTRPKPGKCLGCRRRSHLAYCDRCVPTAPRDRDAEFLAAYKRNGELIPRPQGASTR